MKKWINKIVILSILLTASISFAETYAVVVNSSNNFSDANGAKKYFLYDKVDTWPSGSAVQPYDMPDASDIKTALARAAFIKNFLGMPNAAALSQHWVEQKSKGQTKKPQSVGSFDEMVRNISREDGGIGFAPKSLAETQGLKILTTFEVN